MICQEQQSGDTETLPCSSSSIVKLFLDMNTRSFTERTLRVRNLIGMVKVNRAQRRRMKSKKRGGSQKAHRHMAGKLRAEQEEKIHNNKVYKKG